MFEGGGGRGEGVVIVVEEMMRDLGAIVYLISSLEHSL